MSNFHFFATEWPEVLEPAAKAKQAENLKAKPSF
jgi:hypothetical protein